MRPLNIVNLLDDFAVGGVTNGLRIFEHPKIVALAHSETIAVNPELLVAPKLDANVIIVHFPPRWRGLSFLLSLRMRNPRARIVHVEHSYSHEWAKLHVASPTRFNRLLRFAFALADEVVAVSRAQARWLIEIGATSPDKIKVIYPYSTDQGLDRVPPIARTEGNPLVIGSYGRFAEAKGFDLLIRAFKQLDEKDHLKLLLGGFGPEEAHFHQLAAGCERIEFFGRVDDHAAFMEQIDIFAAPSRYETFGQIATEAREAGRPLLVSQAGGLPEQVGTAGIVVNCASEEDLLWSLRALHCLPLEAMGAAGRREVQMCIPKRVQGWIELLSSAASNGRLLDQRMPLATAS